VQGIEKARGFPLAFFVPDNKTVVFGRGERYVNALET
jgi:hypothetical protein